MKDPNEIINVELTDAERFFLRYGLVEWGGPAHCTNEIAMAIGFKDKDDLLGQIYMLADNVVEGVAFTRDYWTRILLATEICFVSDLVGSGIDWESTTGLSDMESIQRLRGIQRKLAKSDVLLYEKFI